MLTVGSLFSGIGGFDLGLERTEGFRTVWFCEQDEFCQRVLAKHWRDVPCYPDVTDLGAGRGWHPAPVDVLCGGFPCQDISVAGRGAGIDGERSGLWSEYARLVDELRPRYVVVENVPALLARGLDRVLGDLAAIGYDAEWDCIPASAVGAPHQRDRVWLVAYPNGQRRDGRSGELRLAGRDEPADGGRQMADTDAQRRTEPARPREPVGAQLGRTADSGQARGGSGTGEGQWLAEPDVGRVAYGVPARVDRLRALGNALVPQIAEWLGRRILDYEEGRLDVAA